MSDDIRPLLREKIQALRNQIAAYELAIEAIDGVAPVAAPKFAAKAEALAKTKNGKRQKGGYHNKADRGIIRARLHEVLKPGEKIGPIEFAKRIRKAGMPYKYPNNVLAKLRAEGLLVAEGKPRNFIYSLPAPSQPKFTLDN